MGKMQFLQFGGYTVAEREFISQIRFSPIVLATLSCYLSICCTSFLLIRRFCENRYVG